MDTNVTEGATLKGIAVQLDSGMAYRRCHFINCVLIVAGGNRTHIEQCTFEGCRWNFAGPAGNTLNFLRMMYASGQQEFVEQIFQTIRSAKAAPMNSAPTSSGTPPKDDPGFLQ